MTTATGHDPARERCLEHPSPGVEAFAENLLVAAHDDRAGVGAWLHLGTCPEDFGLWEDLVLLALPDGDVLTTTGHRRTPHAERPAGAQLSFRCLEPFARWHVSLDGVATRTPHAELARGPVRDTGSERVRLELDVRCASPVWDGSSAGRGDMSEQAWASDHYQQLVHVQGELVVSGVSHPLDAPGVRDHSRGPRGGAAMGSWGGHALVHLLFPSGRAVGVQRMLSPEGEPVFDMAYTVVDGVRRDAEVLEVPRLRDLQDPGRDLRLRLRTADGEHTLTGEMVSSWLLTPRRLGMHVGAAHDGPWGLLSPGHARWTWDGEVTTGLTERSFGVRGPHPVTS